MSERLSHHPEHRPPTPRQHRSMPCWATTTRTHVVKVHFNEHNRCSGRPETLHSHSKDGGSRLACIIKTNSPCPSSHDEDVNTYQFQQVTICTATLLFQPQLITTLYNYNDYKSSVCCFTHARRHDFIHDIYVICKKSSDAPITTKDNTLLNFFW